MNKKGTKLRIFRKAYDVQPEDVKAARSYIASYWEKLVRNNPKDVDSLIGLPNKYIVPAHEEGREFDFNEMYYWDTYFIAQGLLDEEHKDLVVGMVENLLYMLNKFKIIPNASRTYLMGRSQPPLLTSLIWDVYDAFAMSEKWLDKAIATAEIEYAVVWMGTTKPNVRQVHKGLSRYFDINYLHNLAEAESGWDMTQRFNRRCLDFLPVDLNALLYKYETDFARYYRMKKDTRTAAKWDVTAEARLKTMNKLMYSEFRDWYYDYNFAKEKRGGVTSLAGFYPMWAGMVSDAQAKDMVKALKRFENRGGLATTEVQPLNQYMPGAMPTQWAYPNGWAPLQYIVVKGLERYGFHEDAERIAKKWLHANIRWHETHGVFLEKYNVVQPDKPPVKGVYPTQTGFGWTNAVFERFCKDYVDGK